MRYLCVSDIHLNLTRRFDDTVLALQQIAEIIEREAADKVLILGDTFTSRRPHSKELTAFERWIKGLKLVEREREVIIIRGNHDEYPTQGDQWGRVHSYHAFEELEIPNVKVYPQPHVEDNIFMGHLLLREAQIGPTDFRVLESMSADEMLEQYPDCCAYVLGDVHKPQVIREHPLIAYAGSVVPTDFGERFDEKRVLLLETDSSYESRKLATWKSIPVNGRLMLQYDVDLSNLTWRVENLGSTENTEGAIVKVVFKGTKEQIAEHVDERELRTRFATAKELTIQYEVISEVAPRNKQVNESITPERALELYFDKKDMAAEDKKTMVSLGNEIIRQCRT